MLHNVRFISFVRTSYNRYIASVLAASSKRVADANEQVRQAMADQQAVHQALFGVGDSHPSRAPRKPGSN